MVITLRKIAFSLLMGVAFYLFFLSTQPLRLWSHAASLRAHQFAWDTTKSTEENGLNYAQDDPSEKPVNCEDVMLYIDDSINRAGQVQDTYLIVIGRLGRRERTGLNRIRLTQVESYMKRKFNGRMVIAEGTRVSGLGRVEIYVGGRLTYTMAIRKNSRFFCPSPIG